MLGACSVKKEKQTITVIHSWGGTEKDHLAMRNIYAQFKDFHPDIKVQLISMPTRYEMLRKLEDMIMVGDIPDVIVFGGMGKNVIYDFLVEKHMVLDLQPYIKADQEFANSVSEANKKRWTTKDNQLFTVADVLSLSGGYWYNEEILRAAGIKKLPKIWSDFVSMCEQINSWAYRRNVHIKSLRPSAEGYLYFFDHMLFDATNYKQDTFNIKHDNSKIMDALDRLENIYRIATSENADYSYRDETKFFNEGRTALYINGVWGAPMISPKIQARYALLPTNDAVSMSCESTSLGYVLAKSDNNERQEAAVSFLKYMLSEKVQTQILEQTEQTPANKSIKLEKYKHEKPRLYQAGQLVLDADYKIEVPDNVWSAKQKNYFTNHIFQVFSKKLSKTDFIENLMGNN